MIWYKHLYRSPGVFFRKSAMDKKIRQHVPVFGLYFITLSQTADELLDIIPSEVFIQKQYEVESLFIVGAARGRDAAFEMVRKIIDDIYKKTGSVDVRTYFECSYDLKEVYF